MSPLRRSMEWAEVKLKALFGEACGDDNWQAELPVGDTGRVFDTVATPAPPRRISPISIKHISSTKVAILTSVLILHNHPSGDPVPSPEDMELTRRLAAAGVLMGIDVIDHVVLGDVRYLELQGGGAPVSRVLYFDCFSGISGDMALGALLDAGLPLDDLKARAGQPRARRRSRPRRAVLRAGVSATKFSVHEHAGTTLRTQHDHPTIPSTTPMDPHRTRRIPIVICRRSTS